MCNELSLKVNVNSMLVNTDIVAKILKIRCQLPIFLFLMIRGLLNTVDNLNMSDLISILLTIRMKIGARGKHSANNTKNPNSKTISK